MSEATVIPAGFTFLNVDTFISIKAKDMLCSLCKDAQNRNPDAFDMYIYNDIFSYGVLELVDKTLATLHTKIVKKRWDEADNLLEALVAFADYEGVWTQCDHGDRVELTGTVIGASAVAVFRGLKDAGQLDSAHFPNLENLLKKIYTFAEQMREQTRSNKDYGYVCKAIARRLFENKSKANFDLEIKQLNEWANSGGLDKEDLVEVKAEIKKLTKRKPKAKPWTPKAK